MWLLFPEEAGLMWNFYACVLTSFLRPYVIHGELGRAVLFSLAKGNIVSLGVIWAKRTVLFVR